MALYMHLDSSRAVPRIGAEASGRPVPLTGEIRFQRFSPVACLQGWTPASRAAWGGSGKGAGSIHRWWHRWDTIRAQTREGTG